MGCKECGMAYSMVFGIQYHKMDCLEADEWNAKRSLMAKLARAAAILDETGAHDAARQVRAIRT